MTQWDGMTLMQQGVLILLGIEAVLILGIIACLVSLAVEFGRRAKWLG